MGPRFIGLLGVMVMCFFSFGFIGGCGKRPPSVQEGADLRKAAYTATSEGKSEIIEQILVFYREAEFKRIDVEIDRALQDDFAQVRKNAQATGGSVPVDQAIEGARKLISTREIERAGLRAAVDKAITDMRAIVAKAETNMLIANKLNDVVEEYEKAGVDISAAKTAVQEIITLMKTNSLGK